MSTQFPSNNPTAYFGVLPTSPGQNWYRDRDPNATDYKGYAIGDRWINKNGQSAWTLVANAAHVATWIQATNQFASNAETIAGVISDKAVSPSSLLAKLGPQTAHGILIGEGTSSAIASTSAGTAGQVLQSGGASSDPSFTPNITSSSSGIVTTPNQSGASAYLNATLLNATGDGTTLIIPFDTEDYDIQSEFDTSTYTFTAKSSGIYSVNCNVLLNNIGAGQTIGNIAIIKSGVNWWQTQFNAFASMDSAGQYSATGAVILQLNVGGTIFVNCTIAGGAKSVSIASAAGSHTTLQIAKIA